MGIKKTLFAGIAALALSIPGVANSANLTFAFDWGATNQGADGGITLSGPVNELKFTAESVIVFNGAPFTAGTTFTDYVVLRVDQLFFGGDEAATPYGNSDSMQITVLAVFTGTQLDANNYEVTGINSFQLIYDGPNGGYTGASFGNLVTFTDGQQTETATFVDGVGTNSTLAPDGNLDLLIGLLDLIVEGDFEVQTSGDPFGTHLLGITNSNNHLCGTQGQTCAADPSLILALFGADADVFFHTRSDGSIEKLALTVPEPATLGLFGLALAIMGVLASRRRPRHIA